MENDAPVVGPDAPTANSKMVKLDIATAVRASKFDDAIEDDPTWHHVTHYSPCYDEYLDELRSRRQEKPPATSG